jgi:type IV secretory pathway VirB3-like protein
MCPDPDYRVGSEVLPGASGNVPYLLSPLLHYILFFILGSILSIHHPFVPLTPIAIAVWLLMMLLIALLIQLLLHLFLRARYRTIMNDPAMMKLLNQAQDRMSFSRRPEIWKHPSLFPVLLAISNPLCNAIVISKSAAADILQRPREGEIILADGMKTIQGYRPHLNAVLQMLIFIHSPALSVSWGKPYPLGVQLIDYSTPFLWIGIIVVAGFGLWYLGRPRENPIHLTYGIHPNVAKLIVFRGSDVTPQEAQRLIQDVFSRGLMGQPEKRKKTWAAFMISAAVSIGLGITLIVRQLSVADPYFHWSILSSSALISTMLFMIFFFGYVAFRIDREE